MTNLNTIYNEFTIGSDGMIRAIQTHCGFDISNAEIARILHRAKTASEFEHLYDNTDWWSDDSRSILSEERQNAGEDCFM